MSGHLRILELAGEDAPTYVADYNGTAPHKIFAGEQPKMDAHVGRVMAVQIQELQNKVNYLSDKLNQGNQSHGEMFSNQGGTCVSDPNGQYGSYEMCNASL